MKILKVLSDKYIDSNGVVHFIANVRREIAYQKLYNCWVYILDNVVYLHRTDVYRNQLASELICYCLTHNLTFNKEETNEVAPRFQGTNNTKPYQHWIYWLGGY